MFGAIGTSEIILILLIVIIFFGSDKIPDLARGLSRGMQEFQKASDSIKKEIDRSKKDLSEPAQRARQSVEEAVKFDIETKESDDNENNNAKPKKK